MSQHDESYVIDFLHAARLVQSFVLDVDSEAFDRNIMQQSAVIHQLMIIGEATKHISQQFKDDHPVVPWKDMAGMRDVLIHAYQRINLDEVWLAATIHVPDLITQIEPLVIPSGHAPHP